MRKTKSNNILLHRAIKKALLPNFFYALVNSITYMVDLIFAARFFSAEHVAAIGLTFPFVSLVMYLTEIALDGGSIAMNIYIGRGDVEKGKKTMSIGAMIGVTTGAIAFIITCIFSNQILYILGAHDISILHMAKAYMIPYSLEFVVVPFWLVYMSALQNLGYQKELLATTIVELISNTVFSLFFIVCTPLGMAGLGIGTLMATISGAIVGRQILKWKKTGVEIHFYRFKLSDVVELVKLGLPTTGDSLAANVASTIINNILISRLGIVAVAVYSVVMNLNDIFECIMYAVQSASNSLVGLLYGARDCNGLKKVFKSSMFIGGIASLVWGSIMILIMPLLLKIYDATEESGIQPDVVRQGFYILFAFFFVIYLNKILSGLFQSTEQSIKAIVNAIVADSVLYPVLLCILLPIIGYTGIWLAYGFSYILYFVLFYIVESIRKRRLLHGIDDLMGMSQELMENLPKLDLSIYGQEDTITNLSQKVEVFMTEHDFSKKKSYVCALCLEELAVDFVTNAREQATSKQTERPMMDIKLFIEGEDIHINIRCDGKRYNPFDFILDLETCKKIGIHMAQKTAKEVSYNYMYKINVVDIRI